MEEYSISPNDEKFQLPTSKDYIKEFERLTPIPNQVIVEVTQLLRIGSSGATYLFLKYRAFVF